MYVNMYRSQRKWRWIIYFVNSGGATIVTNDILNLKKEQIMLAIADDLHEHSDLNEPWLEGWWYK